VIGDGSIPSASGKTMAGDDKKSAPKVAVKEKAAPKEKAEAAVKTEAKSDAKSDTKSDTKSDAKLDAKTDAKPEAAPSNYSRGEGQKVVTQAYKDNWDAIFGKKSKKKKR
jgi:ABC-type Na+ efflux pump permease subunit